MTHGHHARPAWTAVVGALAAALLTATSAASASAVVGDTSGPILSGFRISSTTVSVSGLATTDVTFSADLSDPSGVYGATTGGAPAVLLLRTTAPGPGGPLAQIGSGQQEVRLSLTSGTATDGTWTGTWHVPSTSAGTWDAVNVFAQDTLFNIGGTTPASLPADHVVAVTGAHQPILRLTTAPRFVGYGGDVTLAGSITDVSTGLPYPGVELTVGLGTTSDCRISGIPATHATLRSRTDGTWSLVVRRVTSSDINACVALTPPTGGPASAVATGIVSTQATILRLSFFPSVVHRGRSVTVTGVRWPGRFSSVLLEQRVGNRWVVVDSGASRTSGRFTLHATPAVAGRISYRVHIPDTVVTRAGGVRVRTERGTFSAPFTVRVT
jgi:hypothetical protein